MFGKLQTFSLAYVADKCCCNMLYSLRDVICCMLCSYDEAVVVVSVRIIDTHGGARPPQSYIHRPPKWLKLNFWGRK